MQFKQVLLAASLLSLPLAGLTTGAQAQVSGVYVGAAAGGNFQTSFASNKQPTGLYQQTQTNNPIGRGFNAPLGTGVVGILNMGYGFGNGLRAEVEGNYRANPMTKPTLYSNGNFAGGFQSPTGNFRNYGFMANFYYDIDPNFFGEGMRWFQPYIGFGVGYAFTELRNIHAQQIVPANQQQQQQNSYIESVVNGTNATLAYQGMSGAAFSLDSVLPGLALTAEYRYFGALAPTFRATVQSVNNQQQNNGGTAATRFTLSSAKFHPEIRASSVLVGMRYAFDTPEPPGVPANLPVGWSAPAAPPPPQMRSYIVYFANNSPALDVAARRVVAEAVQSARTVPTTSLQLQGHADGTGRSPRNQRLSEQRVQNVTAELVRLGVPRAAIAGVASGAAGSAGADPNARRVDILLR